MVEKHREGALSYKGKKELFEQRAWAVVMGLRYSFFCQNILLIKIFQIFYAKYKK